MDWKLGWGYGFVEEKEWRIWDTLAPHGTHAEYSDRVGVDVFLSKVVGGILRRRLWVGDHGWRYGMHTCIY